jgi:O-antigen ligase
MVTGTKYILFFVIIEYLCRKNGKQYVFNTLWKIFFIFILIIDIAVLGTGGRGIGGNEVLPFYILGNKFAVSYYHMFILILFLLQNSYIKKEKIRKKVFYLLLVYSIAICVLVSCNTGIIGCLVIGLMFVLSSNVKKNFIFDFISRPAVFIVFFIGITFLLVGTDILLSSDIIQNIVTNVLNRNMSLTGRLQMYQVALEAITKKPFWGYGINSTYIEDALIWGNAQNGLLKMLLDYGVIGTIVFIYVCFNAIDKGISSKNLNEISYPLTTFLYGMIICSMVEINLSALFFFGLALTKGINDEFRSNLEVLRR